MCIYIYIYIHIIHRMEPSRTQSRALLDSLKKSP